MDSYCIRICVTPNGIHVSSEPMEAEMEPQGTPVASIEEACQQVQAIYSQQGGDPAAADAQGDKDFTSGFA
jgi:hypothetical protein